MYPSLCQPQSFITLSTLFPSISNWTVWSVLEWILQAHTCGDILLFVTVEYVLGFDGFFKILEFSMGFE